MLLYNLTRLVLVFHVLVLFVYRMCLLVEREVYFSYSYDLLLYVSSLESEIICLIRFSTVCCGRLFVCKSSSNFFNSNRIFSSVETSIFMWGNSSVSLFLTFFQCSLIEIDSYVSH